MGDPLAVMLEARSVALVGASPRPGGLGAPMIAEVGRSTSRPRTYLVNPRYDSVGGVRCHPAMEALPEAVDLALFAVPDAALPDAVAAGVDAGARSVLADAAARDVPVVLLPAGLSDAGRSLVSAHSGALAAGSGAWEALASAYGAHLVGDLAEMADTLELFCAGRRASASGGLATAHDSGFERAHVADIAAELGVSFADVSPQTRARLAAVLDPGLEPGNPLDLWGTGRDTEALFTEALAAFADDPAVGAVALAIDLVHEYDGDQSYPDARWMTALAAGPLSAADHFALLRDYGIPTVAAEPACSLAGALSAADRIGYPVAVKTDEPRIAHKSDVNGVLLSLCAPEQVAVAYADLAERLGPRVVVCAMAPPGVELILGIARDPCLGPLLVAGAGGVLAELLAERSVALPPVSVPAARVMLARLRVRDVLSGAGAGRRRTWVRWRRPCPRYRCWPPSWARRWTRSTSTRWPAARPGRWPSMPSRCRGYAPEECASMKMYHFPPTWMTGVSEYSLEADFWAASHCWAKDLPSLKSDAGSVFVKHPLFGDEQNFPVIPTRALSPLTAV